MKIFFSSYKYDYGKKDWGYSFEYINFYKTLKAMKNIDKVFFYPMDQINLYGKKKFNEKLYKIISNNKFDICFFFMFKDEFSSSFLKKIKSDNNTKTIAWMSDDHWRFDSYSKYQAPSFNWIATTDKNSIEKYHKIGCKNIIYSQWGFNELEYKPKINEKLKYDVSFIGQPHSNRKKYITKLKKDNIDVYCRGQGWNKGRVNLSEMVNIFFNSKINVNFTSSSNVINFKNIIKIFIKKNGYKFQLNSFNEIISNAKIIFQKKTYQIKGRIFEITGAGGFLLTEKADFLEKYFKIGEEIDTFENYSELKDKIKFYLTNKDLRKEIARKGQDRILRDHTYSQRLNHIFNKIMKNSLDE